MSGALSFVLGATVDVGVVDREARALRRGRATAAKLVEADDDELRELITSPTFAERIRDRMTAAAWNAPTKLETT